MTNLFDYFHFNLLSSMSSALRTCHSTVMLVLWVGPKNCDFSKGARNDFSHVVASARTLILMLGKLLNYIQSHYHHMTVGFDTIEVPLHVKWLLIHRRTPIPYLSQTSRINIPIGYVRKHQLGFAFHGESINLIYPLKRSNPQDRLQGPLRMRWG